MFLSKLSTVRNALTPAEIQIADYVRAHIHEIKTTTSQELAEILGIGQSTIIRFSKKLGYASFREFLADVAAEQAHEIIEAEIGIHEDNTSTIKKIVLQSQDIVEITAQCNDAAHLGKAAELLKHADLNILFGIGSSNLFAEYLANQLTKMGIRCLTTNSSHTVYSLIDNASRNTVVFLISESGETKEVLKAAKLAKKKGLIVIAMTRRIHNSLYEHADVILKTVSFDTKTRLNVTTMRCSQLFLIDALYLLIMKSDFVHFDEIIDRSETLAEIHKGM